jgi:hypothetical protein
VISVGKDKKAILFDIEQKKVVKKLDVLDAKSKSSLTVSKFVPGQ